MCRTVFYDITTRCHCLTSVYPYNFSLLNTVDLYFRTIHETPAAVFRIHLSDDESMTTVMEESLSVDRRQPARITRVSRPPRGDFISPTLTLYSYLSSHTKDALNSFKTNDFLSSVDR